MCVTMCVCVCRSFLNVRVCVYVLTFQFVLLSLLQKPAQPKRIQRQHRNHQRNVDGPATGVSRPVQGVEMVDTNLVMGVVSSQSAQNDVLLTIIHVPSLLSGTILEGNVLKLVRPANSALNSIVDLHINTSLTSCWLLDLRIWYRQQHHSDVTLAS